MVVVFNETDIHVVVVVVVFEAGVVVVVEVGVAASWRVCRTILVIFDN